ncbi:hypothetical protein [Microbulbifer sp. JTAC008]|uniref:hypothetical protein n=1 Tax=unclassified Microbulbifer TaxID=2619833 RepID=UPI004039FF42
MAITVHVWKQKTGNVGHASITIDNEGVEKQIDQNPYPINHRPSKILEISSEELELYHYIEFWLLKSILHPQSVDIAISHQLFNVMY